MSSTKYQPQLPEAHQADTDCAVLLREREYVPFNSGHPIIETACRKQEWEDSSLKGQELRKIGPITLSLNWENFSGQHVDIFKNLLDALQYSIDENTCNNITICKSQIIQGTSWLLNPVKSSISIMSNMQSSLYITLYTSIRPKSLKEGYQVGKCCSLCCVPSFSENFTVIYLFF